MSKSTKHSLLLVFVALIWGAAFVAQSEGGNAMGPYTFNCIRCLIAALVMSPTIFLFDRIKISQKPKDKEEKKLLIKAGVLSGIALFAATNLQQIGVFLGNSVGKAGFLTSCYVIGVPILGLFLKRKSGINVWVGVGLTIIGLYLLCINGEFRIEKSDFLLILCAVMFSVQIMIIDHYILKVDGVRLAIIQFWIAAILSSILMICFEWNPQSLISNLSSKDVMIPLLYAAVISSGLGFTFQTIGQEGVNPAVASLILSMESVFSVLAGWILLNQALSLKELIGCLLIFVAIIIAQIPIENIINNKKIPSN